MVIKIGSAIWLITEITFVVLELNFHCTVRELIADSLLVLRQQTSFCLCGRGVASRNCALNTVLQRVPDAASLTVLHIFHSAV